MTNNSSKVSFLVDEEGGMTRTAVLPFGTLLTILITRYKFFFLGRNFYGRTTI
jgi:hypothetical protein